MRTVLLSLVSITLLLCPTHAAHAFPGGADRSSHASEGAIPEAGYSLVANPKAMVLMESLWILWIPPGEWVERATGKHFTGPAEATRNVSIEQIPVYVRSGAIVPMQPAMRYPDEERAERYKLHLRRAQALLEDGRPQ